MYQTKNIPARQAALLTNLTNAVIKDLDTIAQQATALSSSAKMYKEAFTDSVDIRTEHSDLLAKYHVSDNAKRDGGYRLPGVISGSLPQYDIQELRGDNARMQELGALSDEASDQQKVYLNLLLRNAEEIFNTLKKLSRTSKDLDAYLDQQASYAANGQAKAIIKK